MSRLDFSSFYPSTESTDELVNKMTMVKEELTMSDPEDTVHLGSEFDSNDSGAEEEIECCRKCEYGDQEAGWSADIRKRRKESGATVPIEIRDDSEEPSVQEVTLEDLANNCKVVLFVLIPVFGRQIGSFVSRKSKSFEKISICPLTFCSSN